MSDYQVPELNSSDYYVLSAAVKRAMQSNEALIQVRTDTLKVIGPKPSSTRATRIRTPNSSIAISPAIRPPWTSARWQPSSTAWNARRTTYRRGIATDNASCRRENRDAHTLDSRRCRPRVPKMKRLVALLALLPSIVFAQGEIINQPTRTAAQVTDKAAAWLPIWDANGGARNTFKLSVADLATLTAA